MRLKQLSESVAGACNQRAKDVLSAQKETFRQMRAALDRGERIQIAEFGVFSVKEKPGEQDSPVKKTVRFRAMAAADDEVAEGVAIDGNQRRSKDRKKGKEAAAGNKGVDAPREPETSGNS